MTTLLRSISLAVLSLASAAAGAAAIAVQVSDASGKPLADVVVSATPDGNTALPQPMKAGEIEQRGLKFLPLVSVASAEDVTLTYACFSASGAQEETLQKMIAVFESKNPGIKVDVQLTGYGDYFTTLATKVAGGNAPDVFVNHLSRFPEFLENGVMEDITEERLEELLAGELFHIGRNNSFDFGRYLIEREK